MIGNLFDHTHVFGAWAVLPEKLDEITAAIRSEAAGARLLVPAAATPAARPSTGSGGVAVIPLYGVITQRMNLISFLLGGTSTEQISGMLRKAIGDPQVSAVVLDVDSPGGSVFGLEELAAELRRAREQKPIVAVASGFMASGAYWVASGASEIVAAPGSMLGSIGIVALHVDQSAANEMEGLRPTIVHAGRYKTEGSPHAPLSDEGRAYMQQVVDDYYRMFVTAVAAGRGVSAETVRRDYGEGRMLVAGEAVRAGLADRVGTLDATIRRLLSPQGRAAVMRRTGDEAAETFVPPISQVALEAPREEYAMMPQNMTPPMATPSEEPARRSGESDVAYTERMYTEQVQAKQAALRAELERRGLLTPQRAYDEMTPEEAAKGEAEAKVNQLAEQLVASGQERYLDRAVMRVLDEQPDLGRRLYWEQALSGRR
jgi:signal peptide peptidase SppA